MKKLILRVAAMLLVVGAAPLELGVAQGSFGTWVEGAVTEYFLEADCAWMECAGHGVTECCTYWVGY